MHTPGTERLGGRRARRGIIIAVAAAALIAAGLLARPASDLPAGRAAVGGPSSATGSASSPGYSSDVAPILSRSCFRCHGPDRADKGLRLDSYQRIMAGDSYGAILIPGDSSLSAMVSVIRNGTMPHDSTRLTPAEIATLARWIDAGAPQN